MNGNYFLSLRNTYKGAYLPMELAVISIFSPIETLQGEGSNSEPLDPKPNTLRTQVRQSKEKHNK